MKTKTSVQSVRLPGIAALLAVMVISMTVLSLTSCVDPDVDPPVKTVSVGTQTGTLTAGTAGTVTYTVTTENISDGSYTAAVENLPGGVTVSGQVTIASNTGTLTLAGNTSTTAATVSNLKLTLDGATSAAFSLTISASSGPVKTVSVGTQTGTLTAGTPGTVTYAVTTANIANGSYTVSVANLPAGVTITGQVTISGNTGTLTLTGDTSTMEGTTSNLTLTLDGATSAVFSLTISVDDTPLYVITGSGTTFTAAINGTTVGTADQPIQTVIDAIKTDTADDASKIQFGDGTDTLDIGTANVTFDGTSGAWAGGITLTGKITSANINSTQGTILINNGVSVTSMADIANTYNNINARTIYFDSNSTLTINSGTVSGTYGRTIHNYSTGTVNISGGTVSATTGYAVYTSSTTASNTSNTTVNISGGTVSATTGYAVYTYYTAQVNISQESGKTTLITSANSSSIQGTIHFDYGVTFQMTGGTVQNTSTGTNGNAINAANYSGMKMTISGGSVSTTATSGYAVRCVNPSTELILDESPAITGMIQIGIGKFSLGASFSTTDTYNIVPITYVPGIAIENGANFLSNFTFLSFPSFLNKEVSGNDIVFVVTFNYTKTGTTYTITRDGAGDGAGYPDAQLTVDAIKADANGAACIIQFGNGTDVLDIFDTNINFNNTTGTWGAITLKGKIQSTNTAATGIIAINNDISITSDADIKATVGLSTQRAINFNSTGTLTINSGAVSLPSSGYMVYNAYTGTVNITGGTITNNSLSGYAVYNSSSGIVNISGGAIVGANGYAVYNNSNGTVNISGGTVSTTSGYAVRNFSAGTVNITGGTISATIGYAVYSTAAGKINISQDAGKNTLITSANISATQGTIAITGANGELTITGGRVENTSVNAAVRNVIYISNATVKANITGGTIATASTSGDFAVNNTQAGNAANIKVDPACIAAGNNCNNVTAP